ncbi:MAG: ATP-binding protein [Desulfovibrionaceae bacterium]|nr:ATP-binding protein [Desulfovibrionaceae bacterium]
MPTASLPSSRLHATYDPALIPVETSNDLKAAAVQRVPYQDRAMKALDLAVNIKASGFNVYLAGSPNLGRSFIVQHYLAPLAKKAPTPPDIIYVHNFADTERPVLLTLPSGQGRRLRQAMQAVLKSVCATMETRIHGQGFMKQRALLMESYQNERSRLLDRMNSIAVHKGFTLDFDDSGNITLFPLVKGRRVSDDEFASLDLEVQRLLKNKSADLVQHMSGFVQELTRTEEGFLDKEKDLEKAVLSQVLDNQLTPLETRTIKAVAAAGMEDSAARLKTFFADLRADMIENTESLMAPKPKNDPAQSGPPPAWSREEVLSHYRVNLFVDNGRMKGAPVIIEDHPTATNLLGCVERESEMGALVTDFTLVKSGSLHRANGGYLVLRMDDLVHYPAAWEGLLRSLRTGKARMDESSDLPESPMRSKSLRPDPVPLDVKVILIGDEFLYEGLLDSDERFGKLFRIKAELTDAMPRNAAGVRQYLNAICRIIQTNDLPPFDRTALAWLVELGSHICEDQKRLSLKFPLIREYMVEAAALATMERAELVTGSILEKAYAARTYRVNLVEDAYMEEYDRNVIRVETSGSAVGQVNGLAVTTYGNFEFGLPHRISCTVGVGHDGISDIEREAELGGPIHTKAMMIIMSYLTGVFASRKPLTLSGSLFFEQSYAGIEGDSASGAELAALLSALADVPLRLDLAFTGAVSHSGQIMAVGGVTQKVEGFFKVCSRQKLTGTQGVILPADNVDHLMLAPNVLKAVDEGRFAVYPVRSIEEALQLLTGMPAGRRRKDGTFTRGSLYELVDRRLTLLGEYGQNAFRSRRSRKS